jgi:thiol-disulfide isomerase/thioredoxin
MTSKASPVVRAARPAAPAWTRRSALAALPALAAAPWARAEPVPPQRGEPVTWPDGIRLLDGSPWQPPAGLAQVVVFWSTTCPFCRRHNVHVQKLHQQLGPAGPALLTVARDRDPEAVRRYLAQAGYSFPVTLDWRPLAAALSTRNVIPLTVTVDRQGRLREVIPGEMFEEDVLALASLAAG